MNADIPFSEFQAIYNIIQIHRQRVASTVDRESLTMIWEVGGYMSQKLRSAEWGERVVRKLSEYISTQDSTVRGWSYRTLYKMVQFYDTYSSDSFARLVQQLELQQHGKPKQISTTSDICEATTFEMTKSNNAEFVPIRLAQIPNILYSIGWSNHQTIMNL